MTRILQVKTTFTAGEVSRTLLGRGDLRAYANGALTLKNVFIQPTGGVTRRAGLRYIDTAAGPGRLISFEFSTEQTYLLVLTDSTISIYADGTLAATLAAPWTADQIPNVAWTQSADTLLLMNGDLPPQSLTRTATGWSMQPWNFFTNNNVINQPYYKFADPEDTIQPSATTGSITLTASDAIFSAGHVGTRLRVGGQEVLVTAFDSPTVVTATVIETLTDTTANIDWEEQAFSPVHGYPVSACFHQDRLVIGGSRDLPNRMWFSQSGDLFNFDLGTGLDDEAIEFSVLSDQVNAIRAVFSGRDLQVFTSGAEWMVTGDPLTPSTVQILRQTQVGSVTDRYISPVNVDGATLFVDRAKDQVIEFLYTELEEAYQATDLALISRQIVPSPVDMDFDSKNRLLYLCRDDGAFVTLTIYRSEEVEAWTEHNTLGQALSVAAVGEEVYLLLQRGSQYTIEQIDATLNMDCALTGTDTSPTITWAGLDYLEGQTVSILADGIIQPNQTVISGAVTLASPASSVQIGLPYTHIIEPLPPTAVDGSAGKAVRLVEAAFKLEATSAFTLDLGRGLRDIPLRQLNGTTILNAMPPVFSGDIRLRAFGWQTPSDTPLWRIEQAQPLPFTLLSVTTELSVND
jgi:hypothetical protein